MNNHRYYLPNKHHHYRTPRTMNEAFGPYAELDIESSKLPGAGLLPWIVCGCYVAYLLYRILPQVLG